jgi:murein DD-endopeptidase MepM/ murein hydrolase activator NlpD
MQMLKKRGKRVVSIVALIIVPLFFIGMMITPILGSRADQLSDMQKQYNALEQQKKANANAKNDANSKMQADGQQIDILTQQISIKTDMITQLNAQIGENNTEIEAKQQDLDNNRDLYNSRRRANYEIGKTSYIEILLSSKDFTDLISRVETLKVITDHDSALNTKLNGDMQVIKNDKAAVETQRASVVASQNDLTASQGDLQKEISDKKDQIIQIDKSTASLEDQEAKTSQQMEDYIAAHSTGGTSVGPSKVTFLWPMQDMSTYITTNNAYGWRYFSESHPHAGIDIGGGVYDHPISAAYSGIAHSFEDPNGYGHYVMIEHPTIGYWTLYGHCSKVLISNGQHVNQGDIIAYAGNSGDAAGAHLHFEVRSSQNGTTINPLEFSYLKCKCTNITYYRTRGNDNFPYYYNSSEFGENPFK